MAKIIRRICGFFITLSFMLTTAPLVLAAGDNKDLSLTNYWVHIKEHGSWINDLIRNASWGILKGMSEIINYIQSAIAEVLSWNIYTKLNQLDSSFSYDNIKGVALIIVVVAITFAGILLMVNGDKMHVKDSVKNILVALCLIVGMPAIMGAFDDFMFGKSDGKSGYASVFSTQGKTTSNGTVKLLGDEVLAMQLYDNVASVKAANGADMGKQYTYFESDNYNNGTMPRDIDINSLATQDQISKKYSSSTTDRTQQKFSELTTNNCVTLLGMGNEYATLERVRGIYKEGEKFAYRNSSLGIRDNDYTVAEFENLLIKALKDRQFDANGQVVSNGGSIRVKDDENYSRINEHGTFEQAVECIKQDTIWQLNYASNVNTALRGNTKVNLTDLRTLKDYKKMSWITQAVTVDIWEPNKEERVYAYDYDFFPSLIDMAIIIVCLIFALLKLCRMLWEIAFMHIFVPLVIATDAHGSGRAKRALQHFITTFAILIVILISLKLYITLISEIHGIENLIARWGLILAGAHFVIDGSDFIVKMTGLDAGVKSGAATLLGLRSAAGMVSGVGQTAASVGRTGVHYGTKVAGKAAHIGGAAADHIGGAAVGAVAGAASGLVGGVSSGGEGHSSVVGQATGAVTGGTTGAVAGAARGGAEGARRGITGLLGINRNKNSEGTPSGSSTGGGADGGASSASSNGSSQGASSDTGTAATPPPITNGDASSDVSDAGTVAAPDVSTGDSGVDAGAAAAPDISSGDSGAETVSTPDISGNDGDADAASNDVQREGSLFTRAYNAGAAVGGTTGHPINTANKAKNTASNAYSKVKGAKAQYDISQATDNFQTERTVAKSKIKNRVDDFFKGKYKDDGKGGKS